MKNTCPNDIFTCPQKKKSYFLYWKLLYVQNTLACPIRATVINWSFKMLARIWLLLAPGNRASAYVGSTLDPYQFGGLSGNWTLSKNKTTGPHLGGLVRLECSDFFTLGCDLCYHVIHTTCRGRCDRGSACWLAVYLHYYLLFLLGLLLLFLTLKVKKCR